MQRFGTPSNSPRVTTAPLPFFAPQQLEVIVGLLERLTKVSAEWSIGSVYTDERKAVNVVGSGLNDLVEGNEYTFSGLFKQHPKFGKQLDVVSAMPFLRPDRTSIVKYIAKNFKGVGHVTAEKFLNHRLEGAPDKDVALEEVRQELLSSPWTLDFRAVKKNATFKADEESSPVLAYVHRDLATRLGGMPGIKDKILKSLSAYLLSIHNKSETQNSTLDPQIVQKCWATLAQDPYEPTKYVPGYAFTTADAIGASVNIPRDAPVRLKALVAYALDMGCQRAGHVYMTYGELKNALQKIDPRAPVEDSIRFGLQSEMIMLDDEFGQLRYYTPKLYDAEVELAKGLAGLCRESRPMSKQPVQQLEVKLQEIAKSISPAMQKNGLDPSQLKALIGLLTSRIRLHTLTAGPGCGKTQIMEILSKFLEHKDIVFCGPTGMSAKVLQNRLSGQGRTAATIHSTLMGSGRGSFRYNAKNKLDGDVMVVDESSMNGVDLAEAVVAAANSDMHLIFLGDTDQLPSISPGSFLKDILQIKAGDHYRLTTTHRNSGGILDVIEQIRHGEIECCDQAGVTFSHGLKSADQHFSEIASKYITAASKYGFENVALLMSMRAGDPAVPGWNITYANQILRDLCNPHALKIPGTRLFVGDRIIIRENMTVPLAGTARDKSTQKKNDDDEPGIDDTRVVNGDTGTITSFERPSGNTNSLMVKSVCLKLDDGRLVDLPGTEVGTLQHSYALTVHSAQGSEYKKVIAVITPGHYSFINRAMLFTGLSRARDELDINAEDSVLRKVAATPLPHRNSALVDRVYIELDRDSELVVDEDDNQEDAFDSPNSHQDAVPSGISQFNNDRLSRASRAERFGAKSPIAQHGPAREMSLRERYMEMRRE
jgi:exodeoxyribonuclease V alpha subunit